MIPNLAWGNHRNGRIPASALTDIGGGRLLQPDAAYHWNRFARAFQLRWGSALGPTGRQDAYRDLPRQQYMWDHRNSGPPHPSRVASPGNSIHGWARSVDCSGYGTGGSARHNWMVQNAPLYHWSWEYGKSLNEPWHLDYVGPITTMASGGILEEVGEIMASMFDDTIVTGGTRYWLTPTHGAIGLTLAEAQAIEAYRAAYASNATVAFNVVSTLSELIRRAATSWLIPEICSTNVSQGGFTETDRTRLNEIANKQELGQALTSTVALVNEHADDNRDAIIAAMPGGASTGGPLSLSLTIDEIPGTATGTATPA